MIKTVLILFFILIANSYSDIVPLGAIQGNIYPEYSTKITMVDEYVYVNLKKIIREFMLNLICIILEILLSQKADFQ
jgi:hypothetical protein